MKQLLLLLALASGCYLKHYPVTPDVAEAGTYQIVVTLPDGSGSMGTAWAVDDHYAVTAGHMCDDTTGKHELIGSTGRHVLVTPVVWEHGGSLNPDRDICVLEAQTQLSGALIIADHMPAVGTPVGYVGYPNGIFVRNPGKYLGDVDGPEENENDYTSSAICDHGASGSAMYYSRGVFGVVVRLRSDGGHIRGDDGCAAAPLYELRSVLDDYHVPYVSTPDPLDCEAQEWGCDPTDDL